MEEDLTICPECTIVTEQDELDMFGGYCEDCFENLAD